jgi:hypothetical protein
VRRWIVLLLTPAPLVFHALAGCSSDETTNDAGDVAIIDAAPRDVVPPFHRPVAIDCNPSRPAGDPFPDVDYCASDNDCDAGVNGRCIGIVNACIPCNENICDYDTCFADDACAGHACVCRETFPQTGNAPDYCDTSGDCRLDTDCPSGFCSPSYVSGCGGVTYRCRTSTDECISNADCKDASFLRQTCAFDLAKKHWACEAQCIDS